MAALLSTGVPGIMPHMLAGEGGGQARLLQHNRRGTDVFPLYAGTELRNAHCLYLSLIPASAKLGVLPLALSSLPWWIHCSTRGQASIDQRSSTGFPEKSMAFGVKRPVFKSGFHLLAM